MPRSRYAHAPVPLPPALIESDRVVLEWIKKQPRAVSDVAQAVGQRLWRNRLVRYKLMKSDKAAHFGAEIEFFQITEQGHRELATNPVK